jgi:3-hydroxyacyl-CoA dehydrogenase
VPCREAGTAVPCRRRARQCRALRMKVKTIAVIGAGVLGRSIAFAAVRGGYRTIIEDVWDERLADAQGWVVSRVRLEMADASQVEQGQGVTADASLGEPEQRGAVSSFAIAHTIEDAIRDADLIVETLPDEMEMQVELFTILDKFAKPQAIFASTGNLSVSELAEITFCEERCVGMRFGENAGETTTVTLIKGAKTSEESVEACAEVVRRFGKSVTVVEDAVAKIDRGGTGRLIAGNYPSCFS